MPPTRKSFLAMTLVVVGLFVALVARPASAHTIGLSSGEYTAKGTSVVAKLAFARGEVATLVPSVDANRDGYLTASEIDAARGTLRDRVFGNIHVTSGGAPCKPVVTDAGLTEQDGLLLAGRWDCASGDATFIVAVDLLDQLSRGHRHVARTINDGVARDRVLFGDDRKLELVPSGRAQPTQGAPRGGEPSPAAKPSVVSFFGMGMEHILTGYDHLVFILGLILARARFRSLLLVITAFTVAHSITLALSVLNVWAPSARIVEPAIALSIAYVGIENFFVKDGSKRWRITFPFGLVHGFGFAGALREVQLPTRAVPTALVSFNLGVELGQVLVLALLVPVILFLRARAPWFEPRGVRVASGAIALAGGVWFIARVVSG